MVVETLRLRLPIHPNKRTVNRSNSMSLFQTWKQQARKLKHETYALYLACRDRRTPWYARLTAGAVVAYAVSPIDLIPDFIPVLGHLDDLLLIPLGVLLVRWMIPKPVLEDCRHRAQAAIAQGKPVSWLAAVVIIGIWIFCAGFGYLLLNRSFR